MCTSEGYVFATGTTSATLTIPRGIEPSTLTVIDHVMGTAVTGLTAGAVTITAGGVIIARQQQAASVSKSIDMNLRGGWPVWGASGADAPPFGFPVTSGSHNPPSGGAGSLFTLFGGTAASGELSQASSQDWTPTVSTTVDLVRLYLQKFGNPTDNILLEYWDSGGIKTTSTIGVEFITSSPRWIDFPLLVAQAATAGAVYYLNMHRTGARDTTNYIAARITTDSSFAAGGLAVRDNNAFGAPSATDDMAFQTIAPVPVVLTAPAQTTDSYLGITYHHERPSHIRN